MGRLFGRGGPEQAELAGRRLEDTRSQLAAVTEAELAAVPVKLAAAVASPAG